MLKNITMGQYYPVDSRVHRLDPRMKLILTILFIVAVFMSHSFVGYLLLLGFLYFSCKMSRVPFRMLLKGLRPLRLIIILTFLLNLFFTPVPAGALLFAAPRFPGGRYIAADADHFAYCAVRRD